IVPVDGKTAHIVARQAHPEGELVWMEALPRTGRFQTDDACTDIETPLFQYRYSSPDAKAIMNPEVSAVLDIDDPFEGVFDGLDDIFGTGAGGDEEEAPAVDDELGFQTVAWLLPDPGVAYDICVWWTDRPRDTGSIPEVIERRTYRVAAPVQFELSARIVAMDLTDDVGADHFTLTTRNWESDLERTFPAEAMDAGRVTLDEPIELLRSESIWYAAPPEVTEIAIAEPSGAALWWTVPTPVFPCRPGDEGICLGGWTQRFEVPLPGPEAAIRLCGGSCPPLQGEETRGTMTIEVERSEESGRPIRDLGSWQIGEGAFFEPDADPERYPYTRVLRSQSRLIVQDVREAPGEVQLFGDVRFDRPVQGTIELSTFFGDPACDLPDQEITELTDRFTFFVPDPCRGTEYQMIANVVGDDGVPSQVSPDHPRPSLFVRVPRLPVQWSIDAEILEIDGSDRVLQQGATMAFGDETLWGASGRCLEPGYHLNSDLLGDEPTRRTMELGDSVPFVFRLGTTDGCGDTPGADRVVEVGRRFELSELVAAGLRSRSETVIDVEADGLTLRITISVTPG
ncbi:MAG: hypothetical protein ACSLFP_16870, partial [Acidimicrobiales bacterium]